MALVFNLGRDGNASDLAFRLVDVSLDRSYQANGEYIDPAWVGLEEIVAVISSSAYPVEWVASKSRLKIYTPLGAAVTGTLATLNFDPEGANNALDYTSKLLSGPASNLISVEYVDPGFEEAALSLVVEDTYRIIVYLATDEDGLITTTSGEIEAAIESHIANAATLSHAGAGSADDLDFAAVTAGAAGNRIFITIEHGSSIAVNVTGDEVSGWDIVVTIVEGTATAADVVALVTADPDASALVTVTDEGAGGGIVSRMPRTAMSGGEDGADDLVIVDNAFLETGLGVVTEMFRTYLAGGVSADSPVEFAGTAEDLEGVVLPLLFIGTR